MAKISVEQIKRQSRGLRGAIAETLASRASHFEEAELQLLKFHGTYQQDDRDKRSELRKQKLDKAWSFMTRTKMPGGRITARQYLAHDNFADRLANGTLRLTTRQGIQFHGVLKGDLKALIAGIDEVGLTTYGACGDVVRNTMAPVAAIADAVHEDAQALATEISDAFLPRSCAYSEIWLDGEKLDPPGGANDEEQVEDPIYGRVYLPRKFKIGIAIPPSNDIDIYSQDLGLVPHVVEGALEGYTILIGGGFGMSHGKSETRPHLAKPIAYVIRRDVVGVIKTIVKIQREYGNRKNRKQARMKYLVASAGIPWFRNAIVQRNEATLHPPREFHFESVADPLGWHEQGDGKHFLGVYVPQGRIRDHESGPRAQSAFREIATTLDCPIRITANTNILFHDIENEEKAQVDAILAKHGVAPAESLTEIRKTAIACVSLPTCGLGLAESERVFDDVLDKIDDVLRDLSLESEPILIRMTGCPNGCARPYNADIAFVGRAPKKYAMYVGGSIRGDRLAGLEEKVVTEEEIPGRVRKLLEDFAANRVEGELFSDYLGRVRELAAEPGSEQFHLELTDRAGATESIASGI
ncbi:MAG: NADPH-dependent assimilatory sulfite reductase hemoprotein subunit, partial [Verrucomicrobiales bacterium]